MDALCTCFNACYGKRLSLIHISVAAADKLAGYVQEGIQEVRQNEYVRRSVHAVADTVDTIRNDEQVKKGVRKLKKGTLKAAEAAFQGLKRVLDTDEDDSRKG